MAQDQLRLTPLSELPSRPARSTSVDARAGDGLWDTVLTKADPVHPADGMPADAVLQDAAWAEGQGQFALAATLYSRAFWSVRDMLGAAQEPQAGGGGLLRRLGLAAGWHAPADTPGSGGDAALDSYLAMVRCRLLLGDCGFVCDALHVLELQMWRLGKPLSSNSKHARLVGELLAKAAGDMLCVVARLLARPSHEAMLGEGTLHVHLHRADGLGPRDGGAADPFVRLSLAGNQRKSRTVSRTRDPVWDEHFELRGSLRQLLSEPMLLHAVAAERGAARAECLGSALVDVGGALRRAADAELAMEILAADTDGAGAAVPAGVVHMRLAWRADAAEAELRDDEAATRLLAMGRAANEAAEHAAAAAAFAGACVRQPKPTSVLSLANMLAKTGRPRAALALLALLGVSGLRSAMNAATARELGTRRAELGMLCMLRLLSGGAQAAGGEEEDGAVGARDALAVGAKELSLPVDHRERSDLAAEMARRGHAANAEGDLDEAARCFAAAFRLRAAPAGGGAAAMLSLCAMRRRQGHAGWSARGVALLLASARPMSDAERSAAARLVAAPAPELPPVWTATMLDEVAASLVWLPNAEVFCSGEGLFFTSPVELEAAVAAEAEAFAAAQAAEAAAADADRAALQAQAEAERAARVASAATTAAAERACRWAEAEAQLDAMMSPQQQTHATAVAGGGASPSEHLLGLARILAESPKQQRTVVR